MVEGNPPMNSLASMPVVLVAGTFASDRGAEMIYGRMSERLNAPIITLSRLGLAPTETSLGKLEAEIERIGPSILVGHSQGGLVATLLAYRRPDLVEAVVSLGAPFYGTRLASPFLPLAGLRQMSRWRGGIVNLAQLPLTVPMVSVAGSRDELVWPRSSALLRGSEHAIFDVGHMGLVSDPSVLEYVQERVWHFDSSASCRQGTDWMSRSAA